jgi:hypothetical protein
MRTEPHLSYAELLVWFKKKWGDKFTPAGLAPEFVKYYNTQQRIEVDFGYTTKRGRVGVTSGWCPQFMLLLTKRSLGSSWLLSSNDKILGVVDT